MCDRGTRRQRTGRMAERLAAWFLERRGYRVRERNLRVGRFEIDLVVERGEWLVFVEVKARGRTSWTRAVASLHAGQRRRLSAAASAYAARHEARGRRLRFDVVTVDESATTLLIEHHEDALAAGGGLR